MGDSSGPRDAAFIEGLLQDMGVKEYDPIVVHQLLEVTYRYVTSVLEDARVYSEHAQKKEIDVSDVKLAIKNKIDHSFTSPPPRDYLMEVARQKNATPLPLVPERCGVRLPPERYCLTAPNYRVKPTQKQVKVSGPGIPLNATYRSPLGTNITVHNMGSSDPATQPQTSGLLTAASPFILSPLKSQELPSSTTSSSALLTGPSVTPGTTSSVLSMPLLAVSSAGSTAGSEDLLNMPNILGSGSSLSPAQLSFPKDLDMH